MGLGCGKGVGGFVCGVFTALAHHREIQIVYHKAPTAICPRIARIRLNGSPSRDVLRHGEVHVAYIQLEAEQIHQTLHINFRTHIVITGFL